MERIEITEENVEIYKKFIDIKDGSEMLKLVLILPILGIFIYAPMLAYVADLFKIMDISSLSIVYGGGTLVYYLGSYLLANKYFEDGNAYSRIKMYKFKKEHPDFNTDIDVKELKKQLVKYRELSKIPQNIKKQKEECISNLQSNNFNEMSSEEKIAFLEQTKQIIIQDKRYDELHEEKNDTNKVGHQKKLGGIK